MMKYGAKGKVFKFLAFATDPNNNAEVINIQDSGLAWCWDYDDDEATDPVITAGVTYVRLQHASAPEAGAYVVNVDTSNAAFTEGHEFAVCLTGDVVAGGTDGYTAARIGEFYLNALMTQADVQKECEDAIKSTGVLLYTTISAVNSQTNITLDSGPADDLSLDGCEVMFRDSNGLVAGQTTIKKWTGSTLTMDLFHAIPQTVTTNHTVTILPAGQRRGVGLLERFIYFLTITSSTSASAFVGTIKNWWGDTITNTQMSDNALSGKVLLLDSVQGGSGAKVPDKGKIDTQTWNGSAWAITLESADALTGQPVADDTGIISAL